MSLRERPLFPSLTEVNGVLVTSTILWKYHMEIKHFLEARYYTALCTIRKLKDSLKNEPYELPALYVSGYCSLCLMCKAAQGLQ